MPLEHPAPFRNAEAETQTRACYLYLIEHGEEQFHLAGHDVNVTVTGLPMSKGANPQVFTAAQIKHSAPEQRTELDANNVEMMLGVNASSLSSRLRALALYTTPANTTVTIIRVNSGSLPGPVEWDEDTRATFKGQATKFRFAQNSISASLLSLVLQENGRLPRYYYQKPCQHVLYGSACGVDPDDNAFRLLTALDAVAMRGKSVDVPDTSLDGQAITAETFQFGRLDELDASNQVVARISILASEVLPAAAGTRLYLSWWSQTLVASTNVIVRRGCNRTLKACNETFNNKTNFGGMPWIPETSPAIHGLR